MKRLVIAFILLVFCQLAYSNPIGFFALETANYVSGTPEPYEMAEVFGGSGVTGTELFLTNDDSGKAVRNSNNGGNSTTIWSGWLDLSAGSGKYVYYKPWGICSNTNWPPCASDSDCIDASGGSGTCLAFLKGQSSPDAGEVSWAFYFPTGTNYTTPRAIEALEDGNGIAANVRVRGSSAPYSVDLYFRDTLMASGPSLPAQHCQTNTWVACTTASNDCSDGSVSCTGHHFSIVTVRQKTLGPRQVYLSLWVDGFEIIKEALYNIPAGVADATTLTTFRVGAVTPQDQAVKMAFDDGCSEDLENGGFCGSYTYARMVPFLESTSSSLNRWKTNGVRECQDTARWRCINDNAQLTESVGANDYQNIDDTTDALSSPATGNMGELFYAPTTGMPYVVGSTSATLGGFTIPAEPQVPTIEGVQQWVIGKTAGTASKVQEAAFGLFWCPTADTGCKGTLPSFAKSPLLNASHYWTVLDDTILRFRPDAKTWDADSINQLGTEFYTGPNNTQSWRVGLVDFYIRLRRPAQATLPQSLKDRTGDGKIVVYFGGDSLLGSGAGSFGGQCVAGAAPGTACSQVSYCGWSSTQDTPGGGCGIGMNGFGGTPYNSGACQTCTNRFLEFGGGSGFSCCSTANQSLCNADSRKSWVDSSTCTVDANCGVGGTCVGGTCFVNSTFDSTTGMCVRKLTYDGCTQRAYATPFLGDCTEKFFPSGACSDSNCALGSCKTNGAGVSCDQGLAKCCDGAVSGAQSVSCNVDNDCNLGACRDTIAEGGQCVDSCPGNSSIRVGSCAIPNASYASQLANRMGIDDLITCGQGGETVQRAITTGRWKRIVDHGRTALCQSAKLYACTCGQNSDCGSNASCTTSSDCQNGETCTSSHCVGVCSSGVCTNGLSSKLACNAASVCTQTATSCNTDNDCTGDTLCYNGACTYRCNFPDGDYYHLTEGTNDAITFNAINCDHGGDLAISLHSTDLTIAGMCPSLGAKADRRTCQQTFCTTSDTCRTAYGSQSNSFCYGVSTSDGVTPCLNGVCTVNSNYYNGWAGTPGGSCPGSTTPRGRMQPSSAELWEPEMNGICVCSADGDCGDSNFGCKKEACSVDADCGAVRDGQRIYGTCSGGSCQYGLCRRKKTGGCGSAPDDGTYCKGTCQCTCKSLPCTKDDDCGTTDADFRRLGGKCVAGFCNQCGPADCAQELQCLNGVCRGTENTCTTNADCLLYNAPQEGQRTHNLIEKFYGQAAAIVASVAPNARFIAGTSPPTDPVSCIGWGGHSLMRQGALEFTTGQCQCSVDNDCGTGAQCVNGYCAVKKATCSVNTDCGSNAACSINDDCPNGQLCESGHCAGNCADGLCRSRRIACSTVEQKACGTGFRCVNRIWKNRSYNSWRAMTEQAIIKRMHSDLAHLTLDGAIAYTDDMYLGLEQLNACIHDATGLPNKYCRKKNGKFETAASGGKGPTCTTDNDCPVGDNCYPEPCWCNSSADCQARGQDTCVNGACTTNTCPASGDSCVLEYD